MGSVESSFSISDNIIPNPYGDLWNSIKTYYKLPEPIQVDCILAKVTFPDKWNIEPNPHDYKNSHFIIYDNNKIEVGTIYMKNDWNGYYGNINFNQDYVQNNLK
jgi:hypothetical protein